ncbi:DMT family transporter [Psychromonas algicola]|uniref:DMT family transporter n=1 Tax=Psychromonas algicola TaxID=2555642 RepID=UPI0010677384|nr:EamA family transporter [Psychromonas sp. RZ5]TEW51687.1 EamA family transporter [Psychromonas sp. RZ5]
MQSNSVNVKGIFAIVVASFLWGTTGTAASYSLNVSALAIGAFSTGIGGLLLVIAARNKLFSEYKLLLQQPKVLLLGGISVAIYPLAFYSSMRLSGVAIGTVVSIASAPLFAALLDRFISKKHISLQWLLSFFIGAIGIVLLVLGKELNSIHNSFQQQSLGVLLGCIAGFAYASYSWAAKCLIEKGVHSRSAMSGLFGCASLLLLPSLWFTGDNLFASSTNTLVSLYMAIIPMFVGYLLFAFGLNFVDASKATLITLIEPIIATILAVFLIGEQFKVIGWVGVCLVSVCLLIQTRKSKI